MGCKASRRCCSSRMESWSSRSKVQCRRHGSSTLPGIDDKSHSLSDYKDKEAVAVIFSCNHCPYVKAWEDRMVDIQRDYGPKGVQLIVINANDVSKVPDDSFPKMK